MRAAPRGAAWRLPREHRPPRAAPTLRPALSVLARLTAGAALAVALPAAAHAQFAGHITAPPRRSEAAPLTPTQVRAERDSARREALSDMRAWVDSAAGIVIVKPTGPGAPRGRDPAPPADSTRPTPPPPTSAPPTGAPPRRR